VDQGEMLSKYTIRQRALLSWLQCLLQQYIPVRMSKSWSSRIYLHNLSKL